MNSKVILLPPNVDFHGQFRSQLLSIARKTGSKWEYDPDSRAIRLTGSERSVESANEAIHAFLSESYPRKPSKSPPKRNQQLSPNETSVVCYYLLVTSGFPKECGVKFTAYAGPVPDWQHPHVYTMDSLAYESQSVTDSSLTLFDFYHPSSCPSLLSFFNQTKQRTHYEVVIGKQVFASQSFNFKQTLTNASLKTINMAPNAPQLICLFSPFLNKFHLNPLHSSLIGEHFGMKRAKVDSERIWLRLAFLNRPYDCVLEKCKPGLAQLVKRKKTPWKVRHVKNADVLPSITFLHPSEKLDFRLRQIGAPIAPPPELQEFLSLISIEGERIVHPQHSGVALGMYNIIYPTDKFIGVLQNYKGVHRYAIETNTVIDSSGKKHFEMNIKWEDIDSTGEASVRDLESVIGVVERLVAQ